MTTVEVVGQIIEKIGPIATKYNELTNNVSWKFIKKIDKNFIILIFLALLLIVLKLKKFHFFALKGNRFDGNDYIQDVIKRGAKVIISEKIN